MARTPFPHLPPILPLTAREKVDAASKKAYLEEALRINHELEVLTRMTLLEPMTRKQAIGVLAKQYGWGDDPKADQAFDKWLRRGLALRKKYLDLDD
jgi:hypothetical protein